MPLEDLSSQADDSASTAAETEETTTAESAPEPEAPKEHVVLQPTSRRGGKQAERESLTRTVTELKSSLDKINETTRAELAARDAQIAEMRGYLSAQAQQVQSQAQQRQAPPDPAALRREAVKHLDPQNPNMEEYHRLLSQAVQIETIQNLEQRGAFRQQPQAPQVDQRMLIIQSQHPTVTMHRTGHQIAVAKDMELHYLGVPDGPERWKKAYEMAEATIKGASPAGQQYTQQGAGALSGIVTSGAGGGNNRGQRGPGVELSEHEKGWARAAGMSLEEYAKSVAESHPERIVR